MGSFKKLPSTLFKTDQSSGEARFEAWRQSISVIFDVAPLGNQAVDSFEAVVRGTHLGNLVVGDLHFAGQQFSRQKARVAHDGVDHYLVQWYRTGGFMGQCDDGRYMNVRPGDVSVLDLSRTVHTFARASHVMSLVIPRALGDEAFGLDVGALHGTVLPHESPLGGLLRDHLFSLENKLSSIDVEDAAEVARASVHMIAACLRPSFLTFAQAKAQIQNVTLERIQRYIGRNLSGRLTPQDLCSAFGVSRAALYRLFEPLGGVASYVQQRRLLHAFYRLSSPTSRRLRVSEVAVRSGFVSDAHFSRAFRTAFGMSPSEVRVLAVSTAHAGDAARALEHLQSSIEYATWLRGLQTQ